MADTKTQTSVIMKFESENGNMVNITVKNALESLDSETVSANMDNLIAKNVFQYEDGDPLAYIRSATKRTVTEQVMLEA